MYFVSNNLHCSKYLWLIGETTARFPCVQDHKAQHVTSVYEYISAFRFEGDIK